MGTPISHIRPIAKGKTPPPGPGRGGSKFYTPMGDCFSLACENLPNSFTISIRTAGCHAPAAYIPITQLSKSSRGSPRGVFQRMPECPLYGIYFGCLSSLVERADVPLSYISKASFRTRKPTRNSLIYQKRLDGCSHRRYRALPKINDRRYRLAASSGSP